jgi:hypothetical protein
MIADWVAILEGARGKARLGGETGEGAVETKLTGNDFLGEIAFADEIGDDVDVGALNHVKDLAEAGFLLPEGANYLTEEAAALDFIGMEEGGGAGVGIDGGTVAEEEEGAMGLIEDGSRVHKEKRCRLGWGKSNGFAWASFVLWRGVQTSYE